MFANFVKYKLFIIRRERVVSSVWLVSLVGFTALLTGVYPGLFPTEEALLSMQAGLAAPPMVAMMGPVYGLDKISPAIAMAQECLVWFAIASIVMNIFFVNRHTRLDEELGRHEMLISLPVGRLTGCMAAVVCAFGVDVFISFFSACVILLLNIDGTTVGGAFCFAFSIGAQGFLFAAITLLTAQLFSTARASSGFAFALMGLFYILRASGDMGANALSYVSPMGLGLKVEAFYTDAFWPVAVIFAEAVVIAAAAVIIGAKRDIGAGVIPARKGRANASGFMLNPFGFAFRLAKNHILIWAGAIFVLGACYGSVVGGLDDFIGGNATMEAMLASVGGASLAESYVPLLCAVMSMLSCIPVIGVMNRLRAEEARGRLEQIYAGAVSRGTLFACFTALAVLSAACLTLFGAVGFYAASYGAGFFTLGELFAAFFASLPATFVMAGAAAFLTGLLPRLLPLVWALLTYSFLMIYFGKLFSVPEFALRLSPFGSVPLLPVEEFKAAPEIIMCAVAALLFAVGFAGYGKRDVGR